MKMIDKFKEKWGKILDKFLKRNDSGFENFTTTEVNGSNIYIGVDPARGESSFGVTVAEASSNLNSSHFYNNVYEREVNELERTRGNLEDSIMSIQSLVNSNNELNQALIDFNYRAEVSGVHFMPRTGTSNIDENEKKESEDMVVIGSIWENKENSKNRLIVIRVDSLKKQITIKSLNGNGSYRFELDYFLKNYKEVKEDNMYRPSIVSRLDDLLEEDL